MKTMIRVFQVEVKDHGKYQCQVFSVRVKVSFKNKLKMRAKYVKHDD